MAVYVCPECVAGKHPNCNGQAWDMEADGPTDCACAHTIASVMDDLENEERGFVPITEEYAYRDPFLTAIPETDEELIVELLEGRKVKKVLSDHLLLDNGTLLRVVPNTGGCSCGAGDYDLTVLNAVDNIITKVEFDYRPTGDDATYADRSGIRDYGYYRIFVFAGDQKINLLQVDGDDGNGYYGTGFSLLVRKEITRG